MRIDNFSVNHAVATIRGWVKGTQATGSGAVAVTDGITTVDPATTLTVANVTDLGGGNASVIPEIVGYNGDFSDIGFIDFSTGRPVLRWPGPTTTPATNLLDMSGASDNVEIQAGEGPASDLSGKGVGFSVGPDFVGVVIGEKDASTVQFSSYNGDWDIELVDTGGMHWLARGDQYTTPLAGIPHVYRLPFAWNTASISTGVDIGTVKAGDLILGAWLDVATAWNSTVSDVGDIYTATSSESLMNATVNMQSVGAGTDRRFLKDGALAYGQQAIMLTDQTLRVKVTSTGISLSAGAATAIVAVVRTY